MVGGNKDADVELSGGAFLLRMLRYLASIEHPYNELIIRYF